MIGEKDFTTRRLLDDILSHEQQHAKELSDWLAEKALAHRSRRAQLVIPGLTRNPGSYVPDQATRTVHFFRWH